MYEKTTTLPSQRNIDRKAVKAETEKKKEKKFLTHISTENTTELNEPHYKGEN